MYVLGMRQQRTGKSVDRRPVSFCDRCCVTPFVTRRARTAAGRRGSGRSRSRRTCSRSRRSARRAGPNAAGVLVNLSKHTFYIRFHLSLCQRYCEQVRLVHLTVLAVPVPQIREQIVDVIKVIPEEWMSKRIRSWMCQCRRSWRKSWRLLLVRSSATLGQASGDSTGGRALVGKQIVDGPVPQIQEKIVEVMKVILREQCQRVLFFFFF